MFSLIITIIAIALVAALALATIYYGSTAFNRGSSSANAAKLMNQSQQILGADRLYRVDHEGAMPPSMQALVDGGYLRTIPVAQINGQFDAVAASTAWTMIASPTGRAYTFSSGDVDVDSCKAVNQMAFGQDGIPNKVFNGFKTQCYGADTSHLAIVVVADPEVLGTVGSTNTELPNSPTIADGSTPSSGDWTSAPSSGGATGGGSGGAAAWTAPEIGIGGFASFMDMPGTISLSSPDAWISVFNSTTNDQTDMQYITGVQLVPNGGGATLTLSASSAVPGASAWAVPDGVAGSYTIVVTFNKNGSVSQKSVVKTLVQDSGGGGMPS